MSLSGWTDISEYTLSLFSLNIKNQQEAGVCLSGRELNLANIYISKKIVKRKQTKEILS
jgi:hypothetical protein